MANSTDEPGGREHCEPSETVSLNNQLRRQFFDDAGNRRTHGNVGESRRLAGVCKDILADSSTAGVWDLILKLDGDPSLGGDQAKRRQSQPCLADYQSLRRDEVGLIQNGQWEGAWLLAHVHYVECVRQEQRTNQRVHKGAPLCNLALIGRELGSPSLQRHYATLSSIGDLYFAAEKDANDKPMEWLNDGGLGPTLVEQFESFSAHRKFRERVAEQMSSTECKGKVLHLEAFLAARWFRRSHRAHILLCAILENDDLSFVEKLLAKASESDGSNTSRGTLFEAAAGLVLSATPGFTVDSARETTDEQVDLVFRFQPERLAQIDLSTGFGLVECKCTDAAVSAKDLRDFGAKCLFHSARIGILVAKNGLSGASDNSALAIDIKNAELARRRWLQQGVTLLTVSQEDLKRSRFNLRGLGDVLFDDWKQLVFGPIAGGVDD